MKFGVISLDFRRYPLAVCFQTAARLGFDGVELWGGRPHAYPPDVGPQQAREILAQSRRLGLALPMYTPNAIGLPVNLCSPLEQERREGMAYFRRAVEVASALEIPRMLLVADHPGYAVPLDDARRWFADAVSALADYAKPRGVTISVEPLTVPESPVLCTADDCARLLAETGRENLDFVLDVAPMSMARESLWVYRSRLGPARVSHVHICNTDGLTDAHCQLDDGVLSVEDFLRSLRDVQFGGFVVAELYSVSAADPVTALTRTARLLRSWGAALGESSGRPQSAGAGE